MYVCSLDGAGWVAGVRKDLSTADYDEKDDVISGDNSVKMVGVITVSDSRHRLSKGQTPLASICCGIVVDLVHNTSTANPL